MIEIYTSEILFALVRIGFCVFIFFGFYASVLNPQIKNEPFENRLVFKWVTFGGFLVVGVLGLSLTNLYDFFGVLISLVAVLLIMSLANNRDFIDKQENGISPDQPENDVDAEDERSKRFLIWQLEMIEKLKLLWETDTREEGAIKRPRLISIAKTDNRWKYSVILVGLMGMSLRLYPVFTNPVPSNTNWFFAVQKVKNIRLQQLFADIPEPPGFYALVSFFETISQVKPELIIHFAEALITFPLCIIIYWTIRKAIEQQTPASFSHYGALLGMAAYAVAPALNMQGSTVYEIYHSKLELALCFAIPAIYGFWHFGENSMFKKIFFWGFLATALTDLFIFLNFLLPALLVISLFALYNKEGKNKAVSMITLLGSVSIAVGIYAGIVVYYGLDYQEFLLWQLFNPQVYDSYSQLFGQHSKLIYSYQVAAVAALLFYLGATIKQGTQKIRELLLVAIFAALLTVFSSVIDIQTGWTDSRQLFYLFPISCAIFSGILFVNILRFLHWIFTLSDQSQRKIALLLVVASVFGFAFGQYEMGDRQTKLRTIPEAFFESYYQITEDRVPYTFTIVAPSVMQTMSQNRNQYIDYTFFLNNFAAYDSLFYQKVTEAKKADIPIDEIEFEYLPNPSVFIFVAKPPFNFQTSNINNIESVMQRLQSWITNYQDKEDRSLSTFYETSDAVIYELKYETGSSQIDETLYEIYTEKSWPMFRD